MHKTVWMWFIGLQLWVESRVKEEIYGGQLNLRLLRNSYVLCLFGKLSVDHGVRQGLTCFVMFRNFLQDFFLPHPVFKHLTWHFNKVLLNTGSRKNGEVCFSTHAMHHMTKFVEEGHHFLVLEQGWLSLVLHEVSHHGSSWWCNHPIDDAPLDQWESCCMIIFIWSWEQIKIEVSH